MEPKVNAHILTLNRHISSFLLEIEAVLGKMDLGLHSVAKACDYIFFPP